jgi:hypothetical protein
LRALTDDSTDTFYPVSSASPLLRTNCLHVDSGTGRSVRCRKLAGCESILQSTPKGPNQPIPKGPAIDEVKRDVSKL